MGRHSQPEVIAEAMITECRNPQLQKRHIFTPPNTGKVAFQQFYTISIILWNRYGDITICKFYSFKFHVKNNDN